MQAVEQWGEPEDSLGGRSTATNPQPTDLLLNAFNSFNEISAALQSAYGELQSRVERLSDELEQSNYYLASVLQSLPCGVLVVNEDGQVTTFNEAVKTLFETPELKAPFPVAELLGRASFSERAEWLVEGGRRETEIVLEAESERVLHCSWSAMRDGERVLVIQDLTRVRQLENQMRRAERIAAMGEMAMEVAHEIRNPLGALELFASLLGEDDLTAEERRRYVGNMQVGIRSLNTVLTNMLCFRKNSQARRESVRMDELLGSVARLMEPLLHQRGVVVEEDYQDRTAVPADGEMVRQIFTNLVTNAMQVLSEGGHIRLRTRAAEDVLCVEVEDTGPGIPDEFLQTIFDAGFSKREGGNGLGLAIVHRFMNALGGTIRVFSREGVGTRFVLSFPKESRQS